MMYVFNRFVAITFSLFVFSTLIQSEEKNPEDPTKVITKLGVGYTDELVFSGALSLDAVRKINARINEDGSEWRIGGSWLFDFGIVNFDFGRIDYDGDAYKNSYSVGTFIPLTALGVSTGKWQLFPMAGFNHNEGENYVVAEEPELTDDYVLLPSSSDGGYIGLFALRPLNEQWSFLSILGASKGSNGYSGTWGGLGISYRITDRHSMNTFAFVSDDSYGRVEKISINYTYEFGE